MRVKVSVILIAHNKYPQCLFSLFALENQRFDKKSMEVIMVDDASTDRTPKLRNYRPPFRFRYIRTKQNVGRSKAKNIGLQAAKGEVLIILDSEMILDPEYVRQHYQLHRQNHNLVVTGCSQHFNTYTVLDKRYLPEQMSLFEELSLKINSPHTHARVLRRFQKYTIMILTKKKGILQRSYTRYAYPAPFFQDIIDQFGVNYEGFHLPYIFVITHNISLRRSTLDKVGMFDEGFQGWGCEDWEFGYRLYKQGVSIIDNPRVKVYHQEHPRSLGSQTKEGLINYKYFLSRHTEFDVGVQALCWIGKTHLQANELVIEYKAMVSQHGSQVPTIIQAFLLIFDLIFTLLIQEKQVTNLLNESEIMRDEQWKNSFFAELALLNETSQYPKLSELLGWLVSL